MPPTAASKTKKKTKTKKPKKIWNDDLVTALRARQEVARQQGKQSHITWQQGAEKVEGIRQDIYVFSTGRIVGFPPPNLSKTVDHLCRNIIAGTAPILPEGYLPSNFEEQAQQQQQQQHHHHHPSENPYDNDHYNKNIKIRGGAFAILMAFHCSSLNNGGANCSITMSKDQLIRAAQPFCDDAMESNYHAGRLHGAWKANDTLQKHNLITCQKARVTYNERAQGLRCAPGSKSSYTLTRQGELFIQALLKRRPEIQEQIDSVRHGATSGGGGRAAAAAGSTNHHHPFSNNARATTTASTPSKNKHSAADRQRLMEWLQTATIGSSKEFSGLGKERRKYLHNVCDELSSSNEFLRDGKVLHHESSGTSRSRSLVISLEKRIQQPSVLPRKVGGNPYAKAAPAAATATATTAVVSPPPRTAASYAAASHHYDSSDDDDLFNNSFRSEFGGEGHALDTSLSSSASTTPSKRKIPANEAAAHAAHLRQALFESSQELRPESKEAHNNKKNKSVATKAVASTHPHASISTTVPASKRQTFVKSEMEDRSDMDRKMPAKSTNAKPDILELLESDDDEDELLGGGPVFAQKRAAACRSTSSTTTTSPADGAGIIDLTEEDEHETRASSTTAAAPDNDYEPYTYQDVSMTILIDNRERTQNCKPRYLRTELVRLLASGPLALAWPQKKDSIPKPDVEERALIHGDFCFELHKRPQEERAGVPNEERAGTTSMIPVCIERKRVADLVQRSASRDHWNQLQRMRDRKVVSIFLLEGDFRSAGTSVMPFSNGGDDEWSAHSHTIEDQESILRFMARAILSTEFVRFIQTKDEQESLRAIAATGLVSATSARVRQRQRQQEQAGAPFSNTTGTPVQGEQTKLADRLQAGGIPWQLAKTISQEIGSVQQLDRLYNSAKGDTDCQSQLLVPFIQESCGKLQSHSSIASWSTAIRQVYFTPLSDPTTGKKAYRAHEHLVSNHAALLAEFHSSASISPEAALDAALSTESKPDLKRKVFICLPDTLLDVLPPAPRATGDEDEALTVGDNGDASFYEATINEALTPLPTIVLQTVDACYQSKPVFVCILDGQDITERLRSAMTTSATAATTGTQKRDGLEAARIVAKKIHQECVTSCNASMKAQQRQKNVQSLAQTMVLIVRGLRPALDRQAKSSSSYLAELRAVMDMVLAELMISHNIVVLQAIRKNGDLELIVQEFALACFHFQVLTEKKHK